MQMHFKKCIKGSKFWNFSHSNIHFQKTLNLRHIHSLNTRATIQMSDEPPPPAPVLDDATTKDGPAAEQAKPAAEQAEPAAEQAEPAAEQAGPAAEQAGPPAQSSSNGATTGQDEATNKVTDEPPPAVPETTKETPTQMPDGLPAAPETPTQMEDGLPTAPETTEEPPAQVQNEPSTTGPSTRESDEPSSHVSKAHLQPRKVPVNSFKDVRPVLLQELGQLKYPFVKKLEKQTGMNREKLFYCVVGFVVFYLMFGPGNALVSNQIVSVYPICQSLLIARTQNKSDSTQWLAYWCAFGLFALIDHVIAPFELLFGLYLVLKTTALLFLELPQTYGAHNVYVKYVHPLVNRLGKRKTR